MRKNLLIKLCLCLLFLFISQRSFSQGEGTKWYFGANAGLDFSTNPPTILTGALTTEEGCSSIADAAGGLQFYTDGVTVYNKLHQVMFNGTGLGGHSSSTQSALIVKQPGNTNLYYIFTVENCGGIWGGSSGWLSYSIVDMSLQSGLGAVTIKNAGLYSPTTEKLTGIRHCNGSDIWILSHEFNNATFRAYLLTSTGVSNTSTNTTTGRILDQNCPLGCMKASPSGRKLGLGTWNYLDLYDFNTSTGIVSNFQQLFDGTTNGTINGGLCYGVEFSPDGTKLYGSNNVTSIEGYVYQWDLCAGSLPAIIASQYTVSGNALNPYTLQLAPNGKIYLARWNKQYLDVINNPNLSGGACSYADSAQSIAPNKNQGGLPNFAIGTIKESLTYTISQNCSTLSFTAPSISNQAILNCTSPGYSVTGITWLFGDPGSGALNTSTLYNPSHTFTSPGTYTVKFVATYNFCSPDTIIRKIYISAPVAFSVQSASSCAGGATVTIPPGNYSYLWSSGNYTTSAVSGLQSGNYTVSVINNLSGCAASQTVQVTKLVTPTLVVGGTLTRCKNETFTITVAGANTYSWSTGSTGTLLTVSPSTNTTYTVIGTNVANLCSSSTVVSLHVLTCNNVADIDTSSNWFDIYPNPSSGKLNIEAVTPATIFLYDKLGRIVLDTKLVAGKNTIDITALSGGMYILRISMDKGLNTSRILKIDD